MLLLGVGSIGQRHCHRTTPRPFQGKRDGVGVARPYGLDFGKLDAGRGPNGGRAETTAHGDTVRLCPCVPQCAASGVGGAKLQGGPAVGGNGIAGIQHGSV